MQRPNKKSFVYIKTAVAVMLAVVLAAVSLGCSFMRDLFKPDQVKFTKRSLELFTGDTYNISSIIKSDGSDYTISSSDPGVVTVDNDALVITAVGAGTAYITAETKEESDRLKVTVTKKEEDAVILSTNGDTVQTLGKTSIVIFNAMITGEPKKSDSVYWYVNGTLVSRLDKDAGFEFTPDGIGEFTVTAKCGEITSEGITVRVFKDVNAEVSVTGELSQEEDFDDIVFTVTVSGDETDLYYQYYEDDRVLYEGDSATYTYMPTPGRHELSVKVNGQTKYSEPAVFRGAIRPTATDLVFDNLYPHAYFRFDAVGKAQVEISYPTGGESEYSQNNSEYADLFDENGFDVGGLIELCARDSQRRSYRFRVKSLGDDDAITESDYSDYITFTQLPSAAKSYVTNVLPCGDLYVTSDEEYVRIAEYYIFFRRKIENASVSFDCYIAYDRSGVASDLWNAAFPIAATSGTYSDIRVVDLSGGVMRTSFKVSTVNNPTMQLSDSEERSEQLHAILPHINYDVSKNRPVDYSFAIDRKERSVEVTYSDELYLAAQNGVKPLPQVGSSAYIIYQKARAILRSICTDDMTDAQKAHAIYDWIMWQVTYDTPVTLLRSDSETYGSYYLEGVFGDGATEIGSTQYKPYAVCDGMSKAYSLMCNIEGIPCVRVVGKAGKSLRAAGGHAWNKVYIDGEWYMVDCTWGDSHVTFSLDGITQEYEIGSHNYLFKTDAQVNGTHFEPYRYDDKTSIIYAPKTAATPLNVYADMTVNGETVNCYIAKTENQLNRVREIATAFARAYVKRNSITVPGGVGGGTYNIKYQAIEIYAEDGFTINDSTVSSTVTSAIRNVHRGATVKVLSLEDSVLVLMHT